ncbi:hypothetical protein B0T21DRAFT_376419 [Apiosordaria backusii]|uniref:NAD(P)-binding protein n=1 Tax=Apiosordaria backusii TaxID=314023 RepID=A0AA40AAM9_9PEZI|nr:hypothetical protein B0T21DRAFT_376419 [Apiosordaria backusii]
MPVYVVTGTNRGIGLEFVRQLVQDHANIVVACVRSPASDVGNLRSVIEASENPNAIILDCGISSTESINRFVETLAKQKVLANQKVDFLIHNAALNLRPGMNSLNLEPDLVHQMITANVLGPALLTSPLLTSKLLSSDVRIFHISSGLGSMVVSLDHKPRQSAGYSISKAGLNMLAVHQAEDIKAHLPGAAVVLVDPGWVKTDMGGKNAIYEPSESVGNMLKVLHSLEETGTTGNIPYLFITLAERFPGNLRAVVAFKKCLDSIKINYQYPRTITTWLSLLSHNYTQTATPNWNSIRAMPATPTFILPAAPFPAHGFSNVQAAATTPSAVLGAAARSRYQLPMSVRLPCWFNMAISSPTLDLVFLKAPNHEYRATASCSSKYFKLSLKNFWVSASLWS